MSNQETRPLRICDVCGGIDDHPRHVFVAPPKTFAVNGKHLEAALKLKGLTDEQRQALVTEIADTEVQQRHMDCCRQAGCPDGSCNAVAATGAEALRGKDLIKHLTSGAVDHVGEELNQARLAQAEQEGE